MEKEKFYDRGWWKDAVSCTFGTLVGIFLTFGITAYLDHGSKRDIVRKTVKMSIHNIDVSIERFDKDIQALMQEDSLYQYIFANIDRLDQVPLDTLYGFVNAIGSEQLGDLEDATSSIFTGSFEVWQYIDDEKVIGRMNNAFSIIQTYKEQYRKLCEMQRKIYVDYWSECPPMDYPTPQAAVRAMAKRNDFRLFAFNELPARYQMMKWMVDVVRQFNERNKQVLEMSQEELDEMGNLLEQNSFDMNISTSDK